MIKTAHQSQNSNNAHKFNELKYEFAIKAISNGHLLSTSIITKEYDSQQFKTGVCKVPLLFTRIICEKATSKMGMGGSNGRKAIVMFVIKKEAANQANTESDGKSLASWISDYQTKTGGEIPENLVQKVCYAANYDVGKQGGLQNIGILYTDFTNSEAIYAKILPKKTDLLKDLNEQAWGVGISLNSNNIHALVIKVIDYIINPGLNQERCAGTINEDQTYSLNRVYSTNFIESTLKYGSEFLTGTFTADVTKKQFKSSDDKTVNCVVVKNDKNEYVWIDDRIVSLVNSAKNRILYLRILMVTPTDARKDVFAKLI